MSENLIYEHLRQAVKLTQRTHTELALAQATIEELNKKNTELNEAIKLKDSQLRELISENRSLHGHLYER